MPILRKVFADDHDLLRLANKLDLLSILNEHDEEHSKSVSGLR